MDIENRKKSQITRWAARILSIIPIFFFFGVVFSRESLETPWIEQLTVGMFGISIISLALAWRWERLGGWISVFSLLVFAILFLMTKDRAFPAILINLILVGVPASLFLMSAYRNK